MKKILYIITGTSRGLGLELFRLCAREENSSIIAISRRFLEDQVQLSQQSSRIKLILSDFETFDESVTTTLIQAIKNFQDVDEIKVILNASVIGQIGRVPFIENDIPKTLKINFSSQAQLMASLLRFFLTQKHIVQFLNISSGAAQRPIHGWASYCTSKAAMKMLFEVAALEFAEHKNFRFKSIDPGAMDTSMQETIRASNTIDFADLKKFHDLKSNNQLKSAVVIAEKIISETFENS